uniref:G-protein coupled receptors family 1 profile domain-containing protein n=1 Tax=Romanomermis culicivorax TaxID=13658 RepID=A0A915IHR0_ROMCU
MAIRHILSQFPITIMRFLWNVGNRSDYYNASDRWSNFFLIQNYSTVHFVIYVCFVSSTIFGNTLALFAACKLPRDRSNSVSNMFVGSLSLIDLLIGIFAMIFLTMVDFYPKLFFLYFNTWQLIDMISCTVSLYSICAIVIDRWLNLENPLRIFRRKRAVAKTLSINMAHKPTFNPAKGGSGKGEQDLGKLSKQYSSRDLPSHTKLKYRA